MQFLPNTIMEELLNSIASRLKNEEERNKKLCCLKKFVVSVQI